MKLSKLMLTMAVAASAFAACNKQETTPQVDVNKSLKSVTLNLSNATFTKSVSKDKIADGANVQLNSCQVFFSDGTNLYEAYTTDGITAAETYFSGTTLSQINGTKPAEFHFLPNDVNQVIVVGNMGEVDLGEADDDKKYTMTKAQLLAAVNALTATTQQDPKKLQLYGIDTALKLLSTNHADEDPTHSNPVYMAARVELKPAVARFEVTGFEYAKVNETTDRVYNQINVEQMTIRNFWQTATVDDFPTAEAAIVTNGDDLDDWNEKTIGDGNVFTYFAEVANQGWYSDVFSPAHQLKAESYLVGEEPATTAPKGNVLYSYHVFEGKLPQFLLKLTGVKGGANVPLYLMTSSLGDLTAGTIKAGNIYRMIMSFDDLDLEQPEKCIEVTVVPATWKVNVIVPEF